MIVTSSVQNSTIRHITRKQVKTRVNSSYWPLAIILAMQAIISLSTLHNTAFQDEALYLYAGQQIVHHWLGGPAPLDRYAFYFSGYPDVYPVIGGVLDKIGGLELARAFSLLCMMGINVIIYAITQKFFQRPAATFASAMYASLGTVLFVGRLATFDAMCLFLIALATAIAFYVGTTRHAWLALSIGPILVLSILAKYAAMLFTFPVLGLLVFCSIIYLGWWRMLLRLGLALISLVISLLLAYHFMSPLAFHAIDGSTTNRTALIQKPPLELFMHVMYMGGIVYAAAVLGIVFVFLRYRRLLLLALLLFATSWLVPAYHIYKQEAVSLDKHMAFALFFASPLAGCALAWLSGYMRKALSDSQARAPQPTQPAVLSHTTGNNLASTLSNSHGRLWPAGLAILLVVFILGLQQSQNIYAQWANTSDLSYVLHTQMRDGSGRFLVEDIEVARYDARDVTEAWQWNGVYYFYYVNAAHQALIGDPALIQAIHDRYFALVELSFNYQPDEARFIAHQLAASKNYDLIAKIPFENSFGTGFFYLWRSAQVAGHGNFTNTAQVGV